MIIPPPNDDVLEIPYTDEIGEFTQEQYNYIKSRLALPKWICKSCGLTNSGMNQRCADYKCRKVKD
jgi:hypothetical protein